MVLFSNFIIAPVNLSESPVVLRVIKVDALVDHNIYSFYYK